MTKKVKKVPKREEFVPEYLYIEEYLYSIPPPTPEKEKLDDKRGVIVIDIL